MAIRTGLGGGLPTRDAAPFPRGRTALSGTRHRPRHPARACSPPPHARRDQTASVVSLCRGARPRMGARDDLESPRGLVRGAYSGVRSPRRRPGRPALEALRIIPVMTASGPDITRSAAGRVAGESIWLPSVLQGDGVSWTATEALHPRVTVTAGGFATDVGLAIDAQGRLQRVKFSRWGNPDGGDFRYTGLRRSRRGRADVRRLQDPDSPAAGMILRNGSLQTKRRVLPRDHRRGGVPVSRHIAADGNRGAA